MGDGIDDGVGGEVGFEEAGTAIDAEGFGGGIFLESDTAGARSDSDAFGVGEFEDAVVGVVVVREADAVAIQGIGAIRNLEEACGPRLAGERTAFDGAGADDGVRHLLWGGKGGADRWFC